MANLDQRDLTTIVLVVLAVLVGWPLLMMVLGGMGMGMYGGMGGMGYGGMMGGPYGGGGMYGIVGVIVQLVFLLVILGGGYILVRRLLSEHEGRDGAIEELRRAYARGDISDEEFERRRSKLQSNE